jgi:hypothetical protein
MPVGSDRPWRQGRRNDGQSRLISGLIEVGLILGSRQHFKIFIELRILSSLKYYTPIFILSG